jgi:hypothetical protein
MAPRSLFGCGLARNRSRSSRGGRIELLDGSTLPLKALKLKRGKKQLTQISNTLHITLWTVEIKLPSYTDVDKLVSYVDEAVEEDDEGKQKRKGVGCTARLELQDGGYVEWRFRSSSEGRFSPANH